LQKCVSGCHCASQEGVYQERQTCDGHVTLFASEERGKPKIHCLSHGTQKCVTPNRSQIRPPAKVVAYACPTPPWPSARLRAHLAPRSFSSMCRTLNLSILFAPLSQLYRTHKTDMAHLPAALCEHLVRPSILSRRQSSCRHNSSKLNHSDQCSWFEACTLGAYASLSPSDTLFLLFSNQVCAATIFFSSLFPQPTASHRWQPVSGDPRAHQPQRQAPSCGTLGTSAPTTSNIFLGCHHVEPAVDLSMELGACGGPGLRRCA
jgi:hypothetical protein